MKAIFVLPLLLLALSAHSQSRPRLELPEKKRPAALSIPATPAEARPVRHPLAPVTVRKSRRLSFSGFVLVFREQPAAGVPLVPAGPAPEGVLQRSEIPIKGGNTSLVSGGYFMQERAGHYTETSALAPTWPTGNEFIGIVVKSGYPDRSLRP